MSTVYQNLVLSSETCVVTLISDKSMIRTLRSKLGIESRTLRIGIIAQISSFSLLFGIGDIILFRYDKFFEKEFDFVVDDTRFLFLPVKDIVASVGKISKESDHTSNINQQEIHIQ